MSEIVNLPVGDMRVAEFCSELLGFIRKNGDGLPYPAVLGAIEIAKLEIMLEQMA